MDRARRMSTARRRPSAASSSPQPNLSSHSNSDPPADRRVSANPAMAPLNQNQNQNQNQPSQNGQTSQSQAMQTHLTPQAATTPSSRRASKSLQQPPSSADLSSPASSRQQSSRKRSKTFDDFHLAHDDLDHESPNKGGHSLRKRARVDYTLEHIDDDVAVPSSSAARSKKRKLDAAAAGGFADTMARRWSDSIDAGTPTSRRRNPVRKPSEAMVYTEPDDDIHEDENDVQDTIEVGVSYSDFERSDQDQSKRSMAPVITPTSDHTLETPPKSLSNTSEKSAQNQNGTNENHQYVADAQSTTTTTPSATTTTAAAAAAAAFDESNQHFAPNGLVSGSKEAKGQASDRQASNNKAASTSPTTVISRNLNGNLGQGSNQETTASQPADHAQQPSPVMTPLITRNGSLEPAEEQVDTSGLSPISPTTLHPQAAALRNGEKGDVPEDSVESAVNGREGSGEALTTHADSLQSSKERGVQTPAGHPAKPLSSSPSPSSPLSSAQNATLVVGETPGVQPLDTMVEAEVAKDVEGPSLKPAITRDATQSPSNALTPESTAPKSTDQKSEMTNDIQVSDTPESSAQPVKTKSKDKIKSKVKTLDFWKLFLDADRGTKNTPKQPTSSNTIDLNKASSSSATRSRPRLISSWDFLTPYVNGEYVHYPEKKPSIEDEAATSEEPSPYDKDVINDMEPMVDDVDDVPDAPGIEAPTAALNPPTRGSPVPESVNPTLPNSPAAVVEEADEADVAENQEPTESERLFRYRKVRGADAYISALKNYENLTTADLHELLGVVNRSMVEWQDEWNRLGMIVDDYENSLRRRAADAKYEARTRNLHQHGVNHEEPDFVVKGYKAKEKEAANETRYLQGQDRIMASAWGFDYDPHPSKIGRQNPKAQQDGIMTRGRSLRIQPKPTVKATEADEVTGRRQRKAVQTLDSALQDVSRSSTPAPTRGRRRRMANNENDDAQPAASLNLNSDAFSDGEMPDTRRRKRAPRQQQQQQQQNATLPNIVEDIAAHQQTEESPVRGTPRSGRRGGTRLKQLAREDLDNGNDSYSFDAANENRSEPKPPRHRHLLVLKIPKGKNLSEPSSAITDNGDSRPSTASSETSSETSDLLAYDFRPNRQKRFRDVAEDEDELSQGPTTKRTKRAGEDTTAPISPVVSEAQQTGDGRKYQKIKVIRTNQGLPSGRKGTPSSLPRGEEGDEAPKDYKSMTKSEKMSASMKNRWANGNMAGAVEKRKATLAAKKAAQAIADQRGGPIAPKPKPSKLSIHETADMGLAPAVPRAMAGAGVSFQQYL